MNSGLKSRLPAASKVELLQGRPRAPCPKRHRHAVSLLSVFTTPTALLFSPHLLPLPSPNTSITNTKHLPSTKIQHFTMATLSCTYCTTPLARDGHELEIPLFVVIPSQYHTLEFITSALPSLHVTNTLSLQTSLPLSPPRLPSAPSTTTPSPSPCLAPSLVTPTARPRPLTPRRSSSSPRRLPPPPLPGVLPSSALPSSPTASVPSSTPLALFPTRAPPTSAA
jgi:hypothetical protein